MTTLGVLGGIGPEATGEFYARLIAALQRSGRIARNEDYPRILVNSIPAPELVRHPVTEEELAPYAEGIRAIDAAGPDLIVMVCNTIHLYRDRLQEGASAPILDLREAVREALVRRGVRSVGILGTSATLTHGLYAFGEFTTLTPSERKIEELMGRVVGFNRGERKEEHRAAAAAVAQGLLDAGADIVVLGCTEFAVMLSGSGLPVLDTIDVLVEATVERLAATPSSRLREPARPRAPSPLSSS